MANYYVDNTNGNDAHDGLSDPTDIASPHTAEASTDATHVYVTDGILTDGDADDFFNGDYLYNVTRSAGAIISDYDADDGSGNQVVTHGNIANQVATDTFYILKAWQTLQQAMTNLAAGDTAWVRANQTHSLSADLTGGGSGAYNNVITLAGCDSTDDPWGDASDVEPIIDFQDGEFQVYLNKHYWRFKNLEIIQSVDANGAIRCFNSRMTWFENCTIRDNGNSIGDSGIRVDSAVIFVKNCTFYTNYGYSIYLSTGTAYIEGCTFNGGAAPSTDIGLYLLYSSQAYIKDSTFGVTTDHDTADISLYSFSGPLVLGRNVILDSATEKAGIYPGHSMRIEDDEQTHLAFRGWFFTGTLERSAVVERSGAGGTAWSMLGEPNSNCGSEQPLYIIGDWLRGIPIYLDGTSQTITVYAYATSWVALPSVSEFVVEIEHYEGAADWDIDVTADTFAANDQWESFAITLTPGAAGPAYLRIYLKDYEDETEKIYVDPTPIIS